MHPDPLLRPYVPGENEEAAAARRVAAMAAGDEGALAELYDRWQGVLYSLALRITGEADAAEEALEDAFWQAWRQAAAFDPGRGTVRAWLVAITRSRALDRGRALRRVRERTAEEHAGAEQALAMHADGGPGPLEDAASSERHRRVRSALDDLPAEQRQALELAYFEGLSQTEIAASLNAPLGTIKTRVRLALNKLRDSLAGLREDAT